MDDQRAAHVLLTVWRGSEDTVCAFAMSSLPCPTCSTEKRSRIGKNATSTYLARSVLKERHERLVDEATNSKHHTPPVPAMNTQSNFELPPADFVAFLAQRSGLSQEAAEHRLERWFGDYHRQTSAANGGQQFRNQTARSL